MKLAIGILLTLSWAVSLLLIFKLARSSNNIFEKVGGCLLLLVPILGPLLYKFVIDPPPPQHPQLQARGARGEYMHRWLAVRHIWEDPPDQKIGKKEEKD